MHSDSVRSEHREAGIKRKPMNGVGFGRFSFFLRRPEKMAKNTQRTSLNDFEIDTFEQISIWL